MMVQISAAENAVREYQLFAIFSNPLLMLMLKITCGCCRKKNSFVKFSFSAAFSKSSRMTEKQKFSKKKIFGGRLSIGS